MKNQEPTCPGSCASCHSAGPHAGLPLFVQPDQQSLSEEQERQKRQIYEQMNPRRRKFVDRIGYDQWDPFQAPKDPLDIRKDVTNRTMQELLTEFMCQNNGAEKDADWRKGASECALGIIMRDGKFQGIFDFCMWYQKLLRKEGFAR